MSMTTTAVSEAARALAARRKTFGGGRPQVLKACEFCKEHFSSRELRAHTPQCPKRKEKGRTSK